MRIDFFAETEGVSGIKIYSRNLLKYLKDQEIGHIMPPDAAKPWLVNRIFLDFFALRKVDADIVHLASQDLLSGIVVPEINNMVVTVHDIFPYLDGYAGPFYSWMARNYVKNLERNADKVIAISEATKEQLEENTEVETQKIEVVYQGVDLELFRPVEEEIDYGEYFLHVGHELDRKNMDGLIKVFEKIKEEKPEAKLVRVGNKDRTRKLIENSDIVDSTDVVYEEGIDSDRLVKLYSNAEKLLFPSEAEGFGRPMIESLACGTSVVAFDRKPMNEVLPELMLVEWGDTESFAQKAIEPLESPEACREIAGKYSWETTADQTKEVYKKCLN
ncbi:glycosyltransferase family 4 protein [Candidatus Nanohalococcus occultus]|uniref:Glycosyltransferase n=1 Tax=Candidatus Nanohalococcus occultus TaxID=2978047 RepID=A0ABY8CH61_9ARCH|nr:Glycosyltransferase [Candidatus Nanohaloarchaeota archaeon SVXNc]